MSAEEIGSNLSLLEVLKGFCAERAGFLNADCVNPFSQGEWSYGTDGKMVVRVPRLAEVPENEKAPRDVAGQLKEWWNVPEGVDWIEIPELPSPLEKTCDYCKGTGIDPEVTTLPCWECDGEPEWTEALGVEFAGKRFSEILLAKVKGLPGVRVGVCFGEVDPSPFRFEGGNGLIMPMRREPKGKHE